MRLGSRDATATFVRVREGSEGAAAGVRAGWTLAEIDGERINTAGWVARATAPPRSRPLIAGRRLLASAVGERRTLTAVSPAARPSPGKTLPRLGRLIRS
jgi:hypothetical protein